MQQTAGPLVRPFRLAVTDEAIADLNARIDSMRWPDQINDADWSWGMELGYLRELVAYWRNQFDWRKAEARINAYDQYLLDIDGLDIHFIHQRSPRAEATPLLMSHGWPGSIVEFLEVIPMLTEPERFGGRKEDAFHVVCPSLPGYGCSPAAKAPGMHPGAIGRRHVKLMKALGYGRYLAQGGDWGSPITQATAVHDPERCRAIHITVASPEPPKGLAAPMALVAEHEQPWLAATKSLLKDGMGYRAIQATRPQTLGYGLNDSPVGLCAWIAEKFHFWCDCEQDGQRDIRNAVSWDALLTNISLYWHTNTITSSTRLYRELALAMASGELVMPYAIPVPVGMAIYPGDTFKIPRAWAERSFDLVHWFEPERGGHFCAMEQPETFAGDLRVFRQRVADRL